MHHKTPKVSQKIRKAARGRDCTLRIPGVCNHNPETTVLCHINTPGFGGMATKSPDWMALFACSDCHAVLDNRARWADAQCGWDDVVRAWGETLGQLVEDGLIKVDGLK